MLVISSSSKSGDFLRQQLEALAMLRHLRVPAPLREAFLLGLQRLFIAVHHESGSRWFFQLAEPFGDFGVVGMAGQSVERLHIGAHRNLASVDFEVGVAVL